MQRGFSLIEVIIFCFGISILTAVILPRGLEFFQRTMMYTETQRLHTNLRLAQDFSSTVTSEVGLLDFPSIANESGEIRFRIDSDGHGYLLTENNFIYKPVLHRQFPNWINIHIDAVMWIYFSKFGIVNKYTSPGLHIHTTRTTITLNRDGSMSFGEKYHVILHDNGRIRADFRTPSGN